MTRTRPRDSDDEAFLGIGALNAMLVTKKKRTTDKENSLTRDRDSETLMLGCGNLSDNFVMNQIDAIVKKRMLGDTVYCIDPIMSELLFRNEEEESPGRMRLRSKINSFKEKSEAKFIIMPIFIRKMAHWLICIYSIVSRHTLFFDSYESLNVELVDKMKRSCTKLLCDVGCDKSWELCSMSTRTIDMPMPQQPKNSHLCAIYVCELLDRFFSSEAQNDFLRISTLHADLNDVESFRSKLSSLKNNYDFNEADIMRRAMDQVESFDSCAEVTLRSRSTTPKPLLA